MWMTDESTFTLSQGVLKGRTSKVTKLHFCDAKLRRSSLQLARGAHDVKASALFPRGRRLESEDKAFKEKKE